MTTIILVLIGILLYEACELQRAEDERRGIVERTPYGHDFLYR